ncbi:hypothetical protein BDW66DRAFT_119723 [Aspergillus desertorum]
MQDSNPVQIAGDVEGQLADWRRVWGKGEGDRPRRSNDRIGVESQVQERPPELEGRTVVVVVKWRLAPLLINLALFAYGVSVFYTASDRVERSKKFDNTYK